MARMQRHQFLPARGASIIHPPTEQRMHASWLAIDRVNRFQESPMSNRLDYNQVAPAGSKALGALYGYIAQSGLSPVLVDLVYLRVSQINNCAFCLDMHTRDLLRKGVAAEKLTLLQAWREAGDLFDAREQAALAWAETVTRVADTAVPESDFE